MTRIGSLALLAVMATGACAHRPEIHDRAPLAIQAERVRERCTFVDDDDYSENAMRCVDAYFIVSMTFEDLADEVGQGRRLSRRERDNVIHAANVIVRYESFQSQEAVDSVRSRLVALVGNDPAAASLDARYRAPQNPT